MQDPVSQVGVFRRHRQLHAEWGLRHCLQCFHTRVGAPRHCKARSSEALQILIITTEQKWAVVTSRYDPGPCSRPDVSQTFWWQKEAMFPAVSLLRKMEKVVSTESSWKNLTDLVWTVLNPQYILAWKKSACSPKLFEKVCLRINEQGNEALRTIYPAILSSFTHSKAALC